MDLINSVECIDWTFVDTPSTTKKEFNFLIPRRIWMKRNPSEKSIQNEPI